MINVMIISQYFTGIGSRSSPIWIIPLIDRICLRSIKSNYILRSGGADGADTFFENAYKTGKTEIWVPWIGFNKSESIHLPSLEAYQIAATIHPVWDRLRQSVKALHARNCHQILGKDLKTKSKFVICWTDGGEPVGGTATAIKLALNNDIPVLNLGKWDTVASMEEAVDDFLILNGDI